MRNSAPILLNGGYRDDVGIMGIAANDLSLCRNFEPAAQGGIVKTGDFERFDGQPAPSRAGKPSDATARRALIQTVPGEGRILGLGFYAGAVIAVRNVIGNSSCTMYRSTPTGWQAIKTMLPPNGYYRFAVGNFYAGSNTLTLYGVSGTHQAFAWDGTTFIYLHTGNPQFIAIF
ncbi:hypothetical protein [Deefgea sp. CFH1-16]|uniref:hypothetical protein n=1 Tax=Deefgea sp. CFH1-16 TaxID=2675457 RepID=UPI0015F50158|nr:hypothetical protein [Deefgea sp. CFH1-16]MBM5575831.1 hypothetical protein [Deefgea sp. CFH1-16]